MFCIKWYYTTYLWPAHQRVEKPQIGHDESERQAELQQKSQKINRMHLDHLIVLQRLNVVFPFLNLPYVQDVQKCFAQDQSQTI